MRRPPGRDQESFPIRADVIVEHEVVRKRAVRVKHRDGSACFQGGLWSSGDCNRNRRYLLVRPLIEQLLTVAAPAGLLAARRRNSNFVIGGRKWLDINFPIAGNIGGVCHPVIVRRKLTLKFVEPGVQEWHRLARRLSIFGHGENPKVVPGLQIILGVNDEAPVPRPLIDRLRVGCGEKHFILA